ncbi:trafficking kinesin-binding protein 1 isoform X2 [Hyalella azteca]|uniref:Trafficking kinesin-binding protein 1 isoform X2 n=1 Tax=Hyalella azteca TaxID=294128 RepID=A0A979FLK7_HYAAZ|nr:trafficking kinesin-binding protein 1 isoform X2 [Hyalella azteca]
MCQTCRRSSAEEPLPAPPLKGPSARLAARLLRTPPSSAARPSSFASKDETKNESGGDPIAASGDPHPPSPLTDFGDAKVTFESESRDSFSVFEPREIFTEGVKTIESIPSCSGGLYQRDIYGVVKTEEITVHQSTHEYDISVTNKVEVAFNSQGYVSSLFPLTPSSASAAYQPKASVLGTRHLNPAAPANYRQEFLATNCSRPANSALQVSAQIYAVQSVQFSKNQRLSSQEPSSLRCSKKSSSFVQDHLNSPVQPQESFSVQREPFLSHQSSSSLEKSQDSPATNRTTPASCSSTSGHRTERVEGGPPCRRGRCSRGGEAARVTVAGPGYPARGGSSWPGLDKSSRKSGCPLPDLVSPTSAQHNIASLYFSQDSSEPLSIVDLSTSIIKVGAPKLDVAKDYVCHVDPADLLSNPDLGPFRPSPPKTLPLAPSKTKKNVENERSKESYAAYKDSVADASPSKDQSPGQEVPKEASSSPTEVRQQIRECLDRVRSRRTASSSEAPAATPAGVNTPTADSSAPHSDDSQPRSAASFAAGLYRLERLLRRGADAAPREPATPGPTSLTSRDASTITDVHQSEHLAEVEIISLVQEQIPSYRLRADPAAAAAGCSRDSWGGIVPFPALEAEDGASSPLSPEQAEATLQYFVLCGSRVSQMTKTYNDVDAVTRLLEEKEKDLELAARIGQQLVCRNRALEERQALLEQELQASTEANTQLQHQLHLKSNLLSIYTDDPDDSSRETTPSTVRHVGVELLQQKVRRLQEDNLQLRDEASRLAGATTECEEREDDLMRDVIKQLDSANSQVLQLTVELRQKNEESLKQHEEATLLLAQIVDLQAKLKESGEENQELASLVSISRECQQELSAEIAELKERYSEVLDLLHDTQEQLRRYSKKNMGVGPSRGSHLYHPLGGGSPYLSSLGGDSIASELSSLNVSLTPPPPQSMLGASGYTCRVLDTVKMTARPYSSSSSSSLHTPSHRAYTPGYTSYTPGYSTSLTAGYTSHTPGMPSYNSSRSCYTPSAGSLYKSGPWDSGVSMTASGQPSLDSGADSDMCTDTEDNYPRGKSGAGSASQVGVPGFPGTPELKAILKRIPPAHPTATTTTTTTSSAAAALPYGCRTPDYILATGPAWGSTEQGSRGMGGTKLQIIKPMKGSLTLHHWSRLATPDLSGLMQPHSDGIAVKSALGTRSDLELFSLSDLEEDDETITEPRKQFMETSGVFTFTNSTVLHVDDATHPSSALPGLQVSCSVPNTSTALPPSLPASRRGSTATFSTNVGLARVLHERGVAEALTCAPHPTATPANSPEGSGASTPVTSHFTLPSLTELRASLLEGASMIRRTLYPSPPRSPVLPGGGSLLHKVSEIAFVATPVGSQQIGGVIAPRPVPPSPLLHLSNLIRAGHPPLGPSLPSPDSLSPGAYRPPMPSNAPLGVPVPPGHSDITQLPKPGAPRRDLGTVPRRTAVPLAASSEAMGQLGVMKVGRKGGLL